jgi:hypothetical protein
VAGEKLVKTPSFSEDRTDMYKATAEKSEENIIKSDSTITVKHQPIDQGSN